MIVYKTTQWKHFHAYAYDTKQYSVIQVISRHYYLSVTGTDSHGLDSNVTYGAVVCSANLGEELKFKSGLVVS